MLQRGQLVGTKHLQGAYLLRTYRRAVQASLCGGRDRGSHPHPGHFLGWLPWAWLLERAGHSHMGLTLEEPRPQDRPVDRPGPDGGSSDREEEGFPGGDPKGVSQLGTSGQACGVEPGRECQPGTWGK